MSGSDSKLPNFRIPSRKEGESRLELSQLFLPGSKVMPDKLTGLDPYQHPSFGDFKSFDFPEGQVLLTILINMQTRELRLAQKAFAGAMGLPDPKQQESRQQLIDGLVNDYLFFGIATGKQATEELVRKIESSASAQAPERVRPNH